MNFTEFTPDVVKRVGRFYAWVQTIVPFVYDNSLSYMEILGKMAQYCNEIASRQNELSGIFDSLASWTNEQIKEQVDFINTFTSNIRTEWENYKQELNGQYADFTAKIEAEISSFESTMLERQNNFEAALTSEMNTFQENLTNDFKDFQEQITNAQNSFQTTLMESWTDYKNGVDTTLNEYKEYMDNYFANLDVSGEIKSVLEAMYDDGRLAALIDEMFDTKGEVVQLVAVGNEPVTASMGDKYYNTEDEKFYEYNGTNWIEYKGNGHNLYIYQNHGYTYQEILGKYKINEQYKNVYTFENDGSINAYYRLQNNLYSVLSSNSISLDNFPVTIVNFRGTQSNLVNNPNIIFFLEDNQWYYILKIAGQTSIDYTEAKPVLYTLEGELTNLTNLDTFNVIYRDNGGAVNGFSLAVQNGLNIIYEYVPINGVRANKIVENASLISGYQSKIYLNNPDVQVTSNYIDSQGVIHTVGNVYKFNWSRDILENNIISSYYFSSSPYLAIIGKNNEWTLYKGSQIVDTFNSDLPPKIIRYSSNEIIVSTSNSYRYYNYSTGQFKYKITLPRHNNLVKFIGNLTPTLNIGNTYYDLDVTTYDTYNLIPLDYATKEDIPEIPTGLLTKSQADTLYQPIGKYLTENDLTPYETKENAENTYLTKTDAQNTYLTKTDAQNTYLTEQTANVLYATKLSVSEKIRLVPYITNSHITSFLATPITGLAQNEIIIGYLTKANTNLDNLKSNTPFIFGRYPVIDSSISGHNCGINIVWEDYNNRYILIPMRAEDVTDFYASVILIVCEV